MQSNSKFQTDDLDTFNSSLIKHLTTSEYPGIPLAELRKQFPQLTPATLLYRIHRLERLGQITVTSLGGRLFLRKPETSSDSEPGTARHPEGGDPR